MAGSQIVLLNRPQGAATLFYRTAEAFHRVEHLALLRKGPGALTREALDAWMVGIVAAGGEVRQCVVAVA